MPLGAQPFPRAVAKTGPGEHTQELLSAPVNALAALQGLDDCAWAQHWIKCGLEHIEAELASPATGSFCHGDTPTMADACVAPQLWNAVHRYGVPLEPYNRLSSIWENCMKHEAFQTAVPERQPGFQKPAQPAGK